MAKHIPPADGVYMFCDECGLPTGNPEDDYGEFICDDCLQNRAEAAWERHCTTEYTSLRQQQIDARKFK